MNTTYQHEVAAAIQELGGDKVLTIIESIYRDGLHYLQEASYEDAPANDLAYAQGFCESIEALRRELLMATNRYASYDPTSEEFGDEHHYALQ